jgi:16S rRNA (uracil1498-N3)-methyltransferase
MADPVAFPSSVAAVAHVYLERLDDVCSLTGDDAHHLRRVRRVRAGEVVTGADGYGRWRVFAVEGAGGGSGSTVELRATSGVSREPRLSPALTVACALTKGERPELVVQKLTELGVDAVVLVRAARSVVRWDEQRGAAARERLRRVAREAGAQCRRARLPLIDGPVPFDEVVGRRGIVLAAPGGAPAAALDAGGTAEWVVLVGPEGGFDDDELARVGDAPRLGVGPHVLRAETAAIAAAAALAGSRTVDFGTSAGDREEW